MRILSEEDFLKCPPETVFMASLLGDDGTPETSRIRIKLESLENSHFRYIGFEYILVEEDEEPPLHEIVHTLARMPTGCKFFVFDIGEIDMMVKRLTVASYLCNKAAELEEMDRQVELLRRRN